MEAQSESHNAAEAPASGAWRDLFFLMRPTLILVVWLFPLAGVRGVDGRFGSLMLLLFQYFCILGSAFIINQLHDKEGDAANGKCETLSRGLVTEETALRMSWILLIGGLAAALALGWLNLLLTLLFFLLTAVFYNKPPLSAKDRPFAGPVILALGAAILLLQGAALGGPLNLMISLWTGLPMVLAGLSISLLTTIPDLAGDRLAGKHTFAVVFGVDRTWIAAAAAMAGACLLALLGRDMVVALPAAVSIGLMIHGLLNKPEERAGRVVRLSITAMGLALVPDHLWLMLLVPVFVVLARRYYKQRFNLVYPSL
jgi:4-hydroxybenzoate polyprenyltransferase